MSFLFPSSPRLPGGRWRISLRAWRFSCWWFSCTSCWAFQSNWSYTCTSALGWESIYVKYALLRSALYFLKAGYLLSHFSTKVMNCPYPSKDFISLFANRNTSLICWATASLSLWDTLPSAYARRIGRGERKQKNAKTQCFSIFLLVYEGGCSEKEAGVYRVSSSPRDSSRNLEPARENGFAFVKKVLKKNGNFGLTLRKRLFCDAKQPLLPRKTYAFGTQNNRFYKALIASELCKRLACEKCLRIYGR